MANSNIMNPYFSQFHAKRLYMYMKSHFFSVSFCLSNCQLCFFFIQSQEEAFVTILTPVKKCKKNGKLLDVDKYLSFTFYNFASGFNLAQFR